MNDHPIHLEQVTKIFRTTSEDVVAMDEVTVSVAPGEFVCVYGASGSGKTTLLNVVAGLETPSSGTVSVVGRRMDGLSDAARARVRLTTMGVIFQDDNLIAELTAGENIELPLAALGLDRVAARKEALEALTRVGIGDLIDRRPADMSGGQRQRVGIARALTGGRRLILADEPTGALDSATSRELFALLRSLADEGVTILLVSHDPLAAEYASRLLMMRDGSLSEMEMALG